VDHDLERDFQRISRTSGARHRADMSKQLLRVLLIVWAFLVQPEPSRVRRSAQVVAL